MKKMEFLLIELYACKWYQFTKKKQLKLEILIELSRDWAVLVVQIYETRSLIEKYNNAYNIR